MSTFVLMKILESSPNRYDKGIGLLSLGKINKIYDKLTSNIKEGDKVLDIGCGTGSLTLRAAVKGATVTGIDINTGMLEIAQKRVNEAGFPEKVVLRDMGVAEIDTEPDESYDVVMSGLCFSELSFDEQTYALNEIYRLLKPNGLLLIADEVVPKNIFKRIINLIIRIPLIIITYILTQNTTKAVKGLDTKISDASFNIQEINRNRLENFVTIIATKKKG